MLVSAAAFAVISILIAGAPGVVVALGLLVGLGVANISFNTLARVLLQLGADPTMQGRVIALHAIVFLGSTPFGGPLIGWVCEQFNARIGMLVSGLVPLLVALAVFPTLRRLRKREQAGTAAAEAGAVPQPPAVPT